MEVARIGDGIVVESEHVGKGAREGSILEVIGTGDRIHYRVRWQDGHESVFFPGAGSIKIIRRGAKAARS